ncbi:MAG: RNA 2'-phosphotransferase, partial [Solobacterium sp.]|nr:RNA 2'-phosphotransferase [Solobacterium sp.]
NQGHSIPVDVGLKQLEPPEVLSHGTGEKFTASIEQQGLIPKTRLYVHLSKDTKTARAVGSRHGRPVIYLIQAGEMHRDGYAFFQSENGVWLTKEVPFRYMTKISGADQ